MAIVFEGRSSDSPYIEQVWRSRSDEGDSPFVSIAEGRLELVISRLPGFTVASVRGPETRATAVTCPPNGDWFAIRFRPGVHMPQHPMRELMNLHDVVLPTAADGSFILGDRRFRHLDFENAEAFVHQLAGIGFVVRDDVVEAIVDGRGPLPTQRSVQRHFRLATGLTPGQFHRIERARHATGLLRAGAGILDVVHDVGYYDQAHLTRSLRDLIGRTPAELRRGDTQLSFLYKTNR